MDTNTIPTPPMSTMPPTPPTVPQDNTHKKIGPVIGTLIILILVIVGAVYFWVNRLNTMNDPMETPGVTGVQDTNFVQNPANNTAASGQIRITNTSDDLDAIADDLNTTDSADASITSF